MAIESLPIPSRGGGIGRDTDLLIFERAGISTRRASNRRAQVAAVRAHETKPAAAQREDFELPRVVGHVMPLTQKQKIVEVGAAAMYPVDSVVSMQGLVIRTARVAAMSVLPEQ